MNSKIIIFLYIIKFLFLSACDSCKVVIPETVFLQEKNEQLKQEKYKISLSLENAKNQINNLEKHKYLASNNQQNNLFLREKNNFTKELEIKEEEINNHKQELQAKEKIINNLNKSISLFEIDNNNIINDIETLKELISKNRKDIDLVINKLLNNNFFKRFITNNSYHDIISDIIADKDLSKLTSIIVQIIDEISLNEGLISNHENTILLQQKTLKAKEEKIINITKEKDLLERKLDEKEKELDSYFKYFSDEDTEDKSSEKEEYFSDLSDEDDIEEINITEKDENIDYLDSLSEQQIEKLLTQNIKNNNHQEMENLLSSNKFLNFITNIKDESKMLGLRKDKKLSNLIDNIISNNDEQNNEIFKLLIKNNSNLNFSKITDIFCNNQDKYEIIDIISNNFNLAIKRDFTTNLSANLIRIIRLQESNKEYFLQKMLDNNLITTELKNLKDGKFFDGDLSKLLLAITENKTFMSGELLKFLQNNNKNMTKISRKMQNKINDFVL